VWLPAAVLLGVGVGVIAGMFGVGGGFLLVPLMHVLLGVPVPAAVGIGLCVTIANAFGAYLRYREMGHAESRFDVMLIGGSLLGVDAGRRILEALEDTGTFFFAGREFGVLPVAVTGLYTALFLTIIYLLWTKPSPRDDEPSGAGPFARLALPPRADLPVAGLEGVSGPVIGYIGFFNGVLAGLIGIGGGICLIPIMLYGFGFSIQKTAGTGIIVVLVVAVVGTIGHAAIGNVHLGLAATMMVGSALAAQVGATLTKTLPAEVLRKALAIVMIVTLTMLIYKLVS
jgi:hypothetical protein